mgnify:CR=1 FL=1
MWVVVVVMVEGVERILKISNGINIGPFFYPRIINRKLKLKKKDEGKKGKKWNETFSHIRIVSNSNRFGTIISMISLCVCVTHVWHTDHHQSFEILHNIFHFYFLVIVVVVIVSLWQTINDEMNFKQEKNTSLKYWLLYDNN